MTDQLEICEKTGRSPKHWVVIGVISLLVCLGLIVGRGSDSDRLQVEVEQAGGEYHTWDQSSMVNRTVGAMFGETTRNTRITFAPGQISDEWLMRNKELLARAPHLQLTLHRTQVTDKGFSALGKLDNVFSLRLYGTPVTDHMIDQLDSTRMLFYVDIARTGITEQGLLKLDRFFSISVDGTQLTDAAAKAMQEWGSLRELMVYGADDATLRRLRNLQLSRLHIYQDDEHTTCSFAELQTLVQKRTYQNLQLIGTNLTDENLADLRKIQSECQIHQLSVSQYESMVRKTKPVSRLRLW